LLRKAQGSKREEGGEGDNVTANWDIHVYYAPAGSIPGKAAFLLTTVRAEFYRALALYMVRI
jgi:hypothetical protein